MARAVGEFSVTCMSKDPKHPRNELCEFTSSLEETLALTNYEVGVSSMIFPDDAKREKRLEWLLVRGAYPNGDSQEKMLLFNMGQYSTESELREDIKDRLVDIPNIRVLGHCLKVPNGEWRLRIVNTMRPIWFETVEYELTVVFSRGLRKIIEGCPETLTLQAGEEHMLGQFRMKDIKADDVAMLYVDCVKVDRPLLTFPVFDEEFAYEPERVTFFPLRDRTFDEIEFEFRQSNGSLHDYYSPGGGMAVVTLLFRPIALHYAPTPTLPRPPVHSHPALPMPMQPHHPQHGVSSYPAAKAPSRGDDDDEGPILAYTK